MMRATEHAKLKPTAIVSHDHESELSLRSLDISAFSDVFFATSSAVLSFRTSAGFLEGKSLEIPNRIAFGLREM
jgi:hypothetical protein